MRPSVLLFGGTGQLGHALRTSLRGVGNLIALDRKQADLTQADSLRAVIRTVQPTVIVNAAAYTAVDRAEGEADLAHQVNGVAPGVLAEEAAALGSLMVHYSTDYVFDGRKNEPYNELDAPAPLSVYGRTKLEGEKRIRAAQPLHWILRCAWLYSAHGTNFLKTMLALAQARDILQVVDDQRGTPTSAQWVAETTRVILEHQLRHAPLQDCATAGTYHVAAAGEVSRFDYARFVVETAREFGMPLRVPADGMQAVSSASLAAPAARPADSRLDCGKLSSTFSIDLPDWRGEVRETIRQLCLISRTPDKQAP